MRTKLKAYDGSDPYAFVSYSHNDERVLDIIYALMTTGCNVWFDNGIDEGNRDYNDEIARRISNCECVLFMVSSNSIKSEYIKDELHFAKKKKKKIIPVLLESDIVLPDSLELMLGRIQFARLPPDSGTSLKRIRDDLPKNVFRKTPCPFYTSAKNLFFIRDTSYVFPREAHFSGDKHNSFEIRSVKQGLKDEYCIFRYQAWPAYDMCFSIN